MKRIIPTVLLAAAIMAAGMLFGYRRGRKSVIPEIITRTEYKTVYLKDPVPSLTQYTGKLIFVPVAEVVGADSESVHLVPSEDTTAAQMVVELPEELKEYADTTMVDDSTFVSYRIGITGYNPSLSYVDITFPYSETVGIIEKPRKLEVTWGPIAGLGYGIITRKPDFFVGAGVEIHF